MTDFDGTVGGLLDSAAKLIADLDRAGDDVSRAVAARLRASVVGPLRQAAGMQAAHDPGTHDAEAEAGPGDPDSDMQLRGRMWEMARAAVELRCGASRFPDSARRPRPCRNSPSGSPTHLRGRSVWQS